VGPPRPIVSFVVGIFTDKLYEAFKEVVKVEAIAFHNAGAQRAYTAAVLELRELASGPGIDSEEFKLAREQHKKALSEFVRFGVARS
jgi:hypothetical protein